MNFSYQDDPQLVGNRAAAEAELAGNKSRALEARRRALISFGSPELARQLLGADDPTVAAISSDPQASGSVLGGIARNYKQQVAGADESLNDSNLYFSGHRGKVLADLATGRQQQENEAQRALSGELSGISGGLADAESSYRNSLLTGEQDAYQRAQDRALQYGIGPEGGGDSSGPPGGDPVDALLNRVHHSVVGHLGSQLHSSAFRQRPGARPRPQPVGHGHGARGR